jgi:hypothetical protein
MIAIPNNRAVSHVNIDVIGVAACLAFGIIPCALLNIERGDVAFLASNARVTVESRLPAERTSVNSLLNHFLKLLIIFLMSTIAVNINSVIKTRTTAVNAITIKIVRMVSRIVMG